MTLFEHPWTGKLMRVDADQMLRIAARGIVTRCGADGCSTASCRRAVLADIDQAYGNVFASIAPDHCFGYRCLDRVDSILHWTGFWSSNAHCCRSNGP